jgi:hypothetical protein
MYQNKPIDLKILLCSLLYRKTGRIIKIKGLFLLIFRRLPQIKTYIISVFILLISGLIHAEKYDDINIEAAPAWVEVRDIIETHNILVDDINKGDSSCSFI